MKKLLAYFKTENDAENAAASLRALNTESVFVERIQKDKDTMHFVPAHSLGRPDVSIGVTSDERVNPLKEGFKGLVKGSTEPEIQYLLEFSVDEDQLNEALDKLADANAYLDEDM